MLISHDSDETRVALLEDRELVELYVERPKRSVVGNVYLAKVRDVLPGMQAAFLDIGLEKNAFLYVDDIVTARRGAPVPARDDIAGFVKSGQEIMVQVLKDPMGTKGARVTTEISLPGRFVVLMPLSDMVGVSRKLPDDERDRLRETVEPHVPEGLGLIVRTAAQGVPEDEIVADLEFLLRLWKRVSHQATEALAPEIIYTEMDLALRLVRDVFSDDFSQLIIDDKATYTKVVSFLKKAAPGLVKRVSYYTDRRPLFDERGLQPVIEQSTRRVVELPSGGYIAIDPTEALTAIDVNTGRFVGRKNLGDTIVKTNLEAAEEVARQLRLRDIGGIIVIDFIDMAEAGHRTLVTRRLTEALERDRTKTRVVEMSRLGLIEMTRKNVTDGLFGVLTEACPRCTGEGRILSDTTRRITVERRMRELLLAGSSSAYLFAVEPGTYELLNAPGLNVLPGLKAETGKQVSLIAEPGLEQTEVRVVMEGVGRGGLLKRGVDALRRR